MEEAAVANFNMYKATGEAKRLGKEGSRCYDQQEEFPHTYPRCLTLTLLTIVLARPPVLAYVADP